MELGNIIHREINLKNPAYKDMQNINVNIVPMKGLVDSNNSHKVYLHPKMEFPIDKQIKDVRKHVYENCLIDKIWEIGNIQIRETVFEFFKNVFTGEEEHIKSLLKKDQTFVC